MTLLVGYLTDRGDLRRLRRKHLLVFVALLGEGACLLSGRARSYGGQTWIDRRAQRRVLQFTLEFMGEWEMFGGAFALARAAGCPGGAALAEQAAHRAARVEDGVVAALRARARAAAADRTLQSGLRPAPSAAARAPTGPAPRGRRRRPPCLRRLGPR